MKTRNSLAIVVLIASFSVLLFNSGQRFSMGLMLKPMVEDLGWSRSTLSLAVTAFLVVSALGLPFAGRLVDKFGAATVLSLSVLIAGLATTFMAYIQTPWQAFVLYGLVFAIGSAGTSITPVGVLINSWFPTRVGLANSVAISGMGFGQLAVITVLAAHLEQIGWRDAFFWLGLAGIVVVLPLLVIVGRESRSATLARLANPAGLDADAASGATVGRSGEPALRLTVRESLSTRPIWWLFVIYGFCGLQDFFVATHVVAFALDQSVSPVMAGNMLAFMGLMGLGGVLATGFITDRFGPMAPTVACFVLRIVLFALILSSKEAWAIGTFALLYGSTFWMTAPLTVVFVRDVYGVSVLGTLAGMVTMVHHGFGGLGAYVGAASFDRTGSYDAAFVLMLVTSVLSIAAIVLFRNAKATLVAGCSGTNTR